MPDRDRLSEDPREPVPIRQDEEWHIDKRINVSVIVGGIMQLVVLVGWLTMMQGDVNNLKMQMAAVGPYGERLARIEEQSKNTNGLLASIDMRLQRMEERRR